MKTILLGDQLRPLRATLKDISGPLRYIRLGETPESRHIVDYLSQRPQATEVPKAQVFRELSQDFREKYVEFIGKLNGRNHSLLWWALPFTNKNPLATSLCRDLFHFLVIVELVRSSVDPLLVITGNANLAAQVAAWGASENVKTLQMAKGARKWRTLVKELTFGVVLFSFLKTLGIWLQVRHLKPAADTENGYTLITSLFHPASFVAPNSYRDMYFGRLASSSGGRSTDSVCDGTRTIICGLIQEGWRDQLAKLKSLKTPVPVVPVESFLNLGDLLACGFQSLRAYFQPGLMQGPVEYDGLDLRTLVNRAIRETYHSGNFFLTLRIYYFAARLARRQRVTRCLYPYENRSWEKMLIQGFRGASPETRLVGYQHASVTLSHTNFILSRDEREILPLPDRILTTGPLPETWLAREGNYPPNMFQPACALRQESTAPATPRERRVQLNCILVTLATSIEEYVNTLMFLKKSLVAERGYQVRVRPHPTITLDSALAVAPLDGSDFYSVSTGGLSEDLQWADVVVYSSSTVGLEAVSLGIPAIRLNLGDFLNTDPMFEFDDLKWSCDEASQLIPVLESIAQIPAPRFDALQAKALSYASDYLSPVTDEALRSFCEA
ncbi:MAG: hypothetical protein ACE5Q6_01975 [Dehalococcoidia bacterium]